MAIFKHATILAALACPTNNLTLSEYLSRMNLFTYITFNVHRDKLPTSETSDHQFYGGRGAISSQQALTGRASSLL